MQAELIHRHQVSIEHGGSTGQRILGAKLLSSLPHFVAVFRRRISSPYFVAVFRCVSRVGATTKPR
jgi:hypothetical protein